jgi:thiamine-phosphate pyrophosphorylase
MERFVRAGLYLVTSQALSAGRSTPAVVEAALRGGAKLVQVREKDLPLRALLDVARELRALTLRHGALLIVNDRIDVALATGADGVHLGQGDLPIADARRIAPDLIIGASSHNEAEAAAAGRQGASYVNIGPLFATQTKDWSGDFLGLDGLRRIAPCVNIPFTVMGGIKDRHIPELVATGARTIAVVTAVTADPDPEAAARRLLGLIRGGAPG